MCQRSAGNGGNSTSSHGSGEMIAASASLSRGGGGTYRRRGKVPQRRIPAGPGRGVRIIRVRKAARRHTPFGHKNTLKRTTPPPNGDGGVHVWPRSIAPEWIRSAEERISSRIFQTNSLVGVNTFGTHSGRAPGVKANQKRNKAHVGKGGTTRSTYAAILWSVPGTPPNGAHGGITRAKRSTFLSCREKPNLEREGVYEISKENGAEWE